MGPSIPWAAGIVSPHLGERETRAKDTGLEGGAEGQLPWEGTGRRAEATTSWPACIGSGETLGPPPPPPNPRARVPLPPITPSKVAPQRSHFLPPSPDSPALLFRKSLSRVHIFSRDRVHADEDLHPTITDEICIDSKIKSNEKKIGSQPDPTVPDCCIEVAERHFFIVSRFQLTTSSYPILPLLV